ncbi:hypothetical protein HKD37_19G052972 [Glycine soja]
MVSEESIIRDNVNDFSDDELQYDVHKHPTFRNQEYSNPYQNRGRASTNDLYEGLIFESEQAVMDVIKKFHFVHSFNFDVIENKSDKYVVMCNQYGNGCYWRVRVSFSKIRKRWELKKINGIHTCTTSVISQDHVRLDSSLIAHNIVQLVKTNPSIEIKTLIANMLQRFGYIVSYKKACTSKQKALEMTFGSWEQSYSYLPIWMTTDQHFVPNTIVRYKTSSSMEGGEDESPRVILNHPCIEGFQYCKPIVQVDKTFLTRKYCDGRRNNFPLAFAIIKSETKEAWMWFLHYLRRHVTPQLNFCIISDRGTGLLAALQSERVG